MIIRDGRAVDQPGEHGCQLARDHGDHRFIEQRKTGRDLVIRQQGPALEGPGIDTEIVIAETIANAGRGSSQAAGRPILIQGQMPLYGGQEKIPPLGAIVSGAFDEALGPGEPAIGAGDLPLPGKPEPDPKRGSRGSDGLVVGLVTVVRLLEGLEIIILAARQASGDREALEVLAPEVAGVRGGGKGVGVIIPARNIVGRQVALIGLLHDIAIRFFQVCSHIRPSPLCGARPRARKHAYRAKHVFMLQDAGMRPGVFPTARPVWRRGRAIG
ncbi:hypothetical protein [Labrys miyagiensis]|uniref:hypothetical protein n=1 Tax=Labrys miyagiensis TaxID=346912 RepID=UPI0024E17685|nr:hypothetical protein [Labrys miyagiensis]